MTELQQSVLDFTLNPDNTLDNFIASGNAQLVQQLQQSLLVEQWQCFYLWGDIGVGKSHLLQAACHAMGQRPCAYLPLRELVATTSPECLEGLEQLPLVCIDDVEQIAGQRDWEVGLFNLYNAVQANHGTLILAAKQIASKLAFSMPDLVSRLTWGLVYEVHDLSDEAMCDALMLHADERGFKLPIDVAQFLLARCTRNMRELIAVLAHLDKASLQQQRRITIPFVKHVLEL